MNPPNNTIVDGLIHTGPLAEKPASDELPPHIGRYRIERSWAGAVFGGPCIWRP